MDTLSSLSTLALQDKIKGTEPLPIPWSVGRRGDDNDWLIVDLTNQKRDFSRFLNRSKTFRIPQKL
jgi:hypothetical protein